MWYGHQQCGSRASRHSAPARAARHASRLQAHGRLCRARAFTGAGAPRTWAVAMRQTPLAAGARRPESTDPGPACQGRGFGYRRHGPRKRGTRWAIRAIGCRPLLPHSARAADIDLSSRAPVRPPASHRGAAVGRDVRFSFRSGRLPFLLIRRSETLLAVSERGSETAASSARVRGSWSSQTSGGGQGE